MHLKKIIDSFRFGSSSHKRQVLQQFDYYFCKFYRDGKGKPPDPELSQQFKYLHMIPISELDEYPATALMRDIRPTFIIWLQDGLKAEGVNLKFDQKDIDDYIYYADREILAAETHANQLKELKKDIQKAVQKGKILEANLLIPKKTVRAYCNPKFSRRVIIK